MIKKLLVYVGIVALFLGTTAYFPAQAGQKDKIPVKISRGPHSLVNLQWDVAEQLGFFSDEGLKVEHITIEGVLVSEALMAGTVDFAGPGYAHLPKAQLAKQDMVMIALFNQLSGFSLMVSPKYKDKIKSVKDLEGKTLGVTSIGSGTHMWLNYLLTKSGIDPSKCTFVGLGTSGIAASLQKGKIHAGIGIEPFTTKLTEAGASILVDGRTMEESLKVFGSPYILIGLTTNPKTIKERAELCQRMVNAIVRTNLFIASASAQLLADLMPDSITGTGQDKETWIKGLSAYKEGGVFPANSEITYDGAKCVVESLVPFVKKLKRAEEIDIKATYDNSFVAKALAKYGLCSTQ